jgi:hypothetical protein
MHRFSKDIAAISSCVCQKDDMNKVHTEGSQILGTSIENSVAQDLCTAAYSAHTYEIWVCYVLQQLNFKYL